MSQPSGGASRPVINGFTLDEVIGVGGASKVYRARQHSVGDREVAIKILNDGFRTDDDRRLFERECLVAGTLDHPNIVRVYQATMTSDGRGCIVMERMAGTYETPGKLPISEVIDVGVKIADVLDDAHRHGVYHQDLKPSNLFRTNRGEPALGDFGIATLAGRQAGEVRMTLRYAPPEKLSGDLTEASGDIYSLGATLFELASGTPPYVGPTDLSLIRAIAFDPVPKLDRDDAPPGLVLLLQRCMAKDPADRPSAREVVDDLRRIQQSIGAAPWSGVAPPVKPPVVAAHGSTTLPEGDDVSSDDEPESQHRWLVPLAAALAALVVVGAGWLIWRNDPGSEVLPTTSVLTATETDVGYVVASPPTSFAVTRTGTGFRFTWTTDEPGAEIWIYRVGTEDRTAASSAPFEWNLPASTGGDCFQARTVIAGGGGLSQGASPTVCA